MLVRSAAAPPAGERAAAALGGAATCFFHSEHEASQACSHCGRFVCALCDLTLGAEHSCPTCFEQQLRAGAMASLRQRDVLYDSIALWAGLGWILVYFTWIFALPAVGYLSIAKWRAPRQYVVPRGRWRYAVAWLGILFPIGVVAAVILIPAMARGAR